MKPVLILLVGLFSLNIFPQSYWDSEFPDYIDRFIYREINYRCSSSDIADGIIADEVIDFPQGATYIATFTKNDEIIDGFVAVDITFMGDLYINDYECPQL